MNTYYRTIGSWSWISFLILALFLSQPSWAQSPDIPGGKTDPDKTITNSIGMKMVLIPAGEFMMGNGHTAEEEVEIYKRYGNDDAKTNWFKDEYPRHRVRITKPFYMGTYEVTAGQFRKFVQDTGYKTDAEKSIGFNGGFGIDPTTNEMTIKREYSWKNTGLEQTDEHPVVNVSWNDAVAFCKWLSRKEGKTYRLPTEAQWEYACRAGTTTRFWSGDNPETLVKVGNVPDAELKAKWAPSTELMTIAANDGYVFTAPVGKFRPNAFGLYDMHGNVEEWCAADWNSLGYYAVSPMEDPKGPDSGDGHVLRGGSWAGGWDETRSAHKGCVIAFNNLDSVRDLFKGFRVARDQ